MAFRVAAAMVVTAAFLCISTSASVCEDFPTCNCEPIGGTFNVYCRSVDNLTDIQQLLKTHFADSGVYKMVLTNCSVTEFPNGLFDNFSINSFFTLCPFSDIQTDAFRNILSLERIVLNYVTFKEIPSGLLNLTHLVTLSIRVSDLVQVTDELKTLKSLTFLTLSLNALHLLAEDAFAETEGIRYLDLTHNQFQFFYENTFDPLKQLDTIMLTGNQLHSVDGLFKSINPQVIEIYDNNITSLDNAFPKKMSRLQSLDIGKNPIPFLNASLFEGKMPELKKLDISDSRYTKLDPELLKKFLLIESVNLKANKLTTIPKGFFSNLLSLQQIFLSSNNLLSINHTFYNCPKLQKLDLNHNIISSTSNSFKNLPQLTDLQFNQNHLEQINNEDLYSLPLLENLRLNRNGLRNLDSDCFAKLTNLQTMEISMNKFTHFNYSMKNLYLLKNLTSKGGHLEYIKDDEMKILPRLEALNLVDNQLKSINGAFKELYSLKYLNIAKNKLTTLSRDTFPDEIKLQELYMGSGNKYECDCRILWLVEWLNDTGEEVLKDEPHCHLPTRLFSQAIRNLTHHQLTEWPEHCPSPCLCDCQTQGRDFFVRVTCSDSELTSVPDVLPDHLGELDLQDNRLTNFSVDNPELINHLQVLKLTNNIVSEITIHLPNSLLTAELDGNQLRRFPLEAFRNTKSLSSLKLSRNPWICDCDTVTFKRWLLDAGGVVVDVNDTLCGDLEQNGLLRNRVIISLTDNDLCPSKINFYVSIAIGTLALLLGVTFLILMYYHNHLYIKVWLYARGWTWVKEEDLDKDKRYDALISYVENDRTFALNTIAAGLEMVDPKFSVCIPERDITSGGNEVIDMMIALAECRRIIIILSESYLSDQFAMQAFRDAFVLSLEDKVHRLIIIQYGKLPLESELEADMKTVLDATKPIVWPEKMFWEKLRYVMPKRTKKHQTKEEGGPSTGNYNRHPNAESEEVEVEEHSHLMNNEV